MKTIVAHVNPDQDAICSMWLVKRFFPGWADAQVKFVPAGSTLDAKAPDADSSIIHVDTGLGKFDHHQSNNRDICAATLVLDEILKEGPQQYASHSRGLRPRVVGSQLRGSGVSADFSQKKNLDSSEKEALKRIVKVVNDVDHALEKMWPDAANDRYDFILETIFDGLKLDDRRFPNEEVVRFGMQAFDGLLLEMKNKVLSGTILAGGVKFTSPWGRGLGVETKNSLVHSFAEREGYQVVVQRDPRKGNVRICVHPGADADLTGVYEKIAQKDPNSDWFLHASKKMLLNGSNKNPNMRPTTLTLKEVIEIIQDG